MKRKDDIKKAIKMFERGASMTMIAKELGLELKIIEKILFDYFLYGKQEIKMLGGGKLLR
jgi:hypothetical protein